MACNVPLSNGLIGVWSPGPTTSLEHSIPRLSMPGVVAQVLDVAFPEKSWHAMRNFLHGGVAGESSSEGPNSCERLSSTCVSGHPSSGSLLQAPSLQEAVSAFETAEVGAALVRQLRSTKEAQARGIRIPIIRLKCLTGGQVKCKF